MEDSVPVFYVCNDGVVIVTGQEQGIVIAFPYNVWDGMVDYVSRARASGKAESLEPESVGGPDLDFDQLLRELRDK